MTLDTGIASVLEVTPGTGVIAPTPVKGAAVLCDDIGWVSESASGKMLFLWNLPEGNACSGDGIFSMNANGTGLTQLQPSKIKDLIVTPVWSPDEKTIAFGKHSDWSGATYTNSIFAMNPDGTSLRLLAKLPANANMGYVGVYPSICWSADGSRILFINNENGDEAHIYTVRADGTGLGQTGQTRRGRRRELKARTPTAAAVNTIRIARFIVDVRRDTTGWVAVGRRGLPFPSDERDRYASRFSLIATEHGGAFGQFVEEPDDTSAARAVEPSARGQA